VTQVVLMQRKSFLLGFLAATMLFVSLGALSPSDTAYLLHTMSEKIYNDRNTQTAYTPDQPGWWLYEGRAGARTEDYLLVQKYYLDGGLQP